MIQGTADHKAVKRTARGQAQAIRKNVNPTRRGKAGSRSGYKKSTRRKIRSCK